LRFLSVEVGVASHKDQHVAKDQELMVPYLHSLCVCLVRQLVHLRGVKMRVYWNSRSMTGVVRLDDIMITNIALTVVHFDSV
jgi:hypothetical protein